MVTESGVGNMRVGVVGTKLDPSRTNMHPAIAKPPRMYVTINCSARKSGDMAS